MAADQLATPADLATLLGVPADDRMTLLVECATAVVQEAAGNQRILQAVDDAVTLPGLTPSELRLPQIPVTAVTSVTLDGAALTAGAAGSGGKTYRLIGNSLWRGDGWQAYCGEPSEVVVTYSHGYPPNSQELQLARNEVLSLASGRYDNPGNAGQVRIDDYAATYDAMSREMTKSMRASLRRKYGRQAGAVRVG